MECRLQIGRCDRTYERFGKLIFQRSFVAVSQIGQGDNQMRQGQQRGDRREHGRHKCTASTGDANSTWRITFQTNDCTRSIPHPTRAQKIHKRACGRTAATAIDFVQHSTSRSTMTSTAVQSVSLPSIELNCFRVPPRRSPKRNRRRRRTPFN